MMVGCFPPFLVTLVLAGDSTRGEEQIGLSFPQTTVLNHLTFWVITTFESSCWILNVLLVSEFALLLRPPFPLGPGGDLIATSSSCTSMVTSSPSSSLWEPFVKPFVFPFCSTPSTCEPFSRFSSFPSKAFTLVM